MCLNLAYYGAACSIICRSAAYTGTLFLWRATDTVNILCSWHGRPSISASIRSIRMYSWAQCIVQKEYCIVEMYPVWLKRSRDLAPPPPWGAQGEHLPPSPSTGGIGDSVYQQPGTKVDGILSRQGGFPSKWKRSGIKAIGNWQGE